MSSKNIVLEDQIFTSEQLIARGYPPEMVDCEDVAEIWYHKEGFVSKRYVWPCPGTREVATRYSHGWELSYQTYDRKRSFGKGPIYSAKNITGGYLSRFNRK